MDTIYELSDEEEFTVEDFLCPPPLKSVMDIPIHERLAMGPVKVERVCLQLLVSYV